MYDDVHVLFPVTVALNLVNNSFFFAGQIVFLFIYFFAKLSCRDYRIRNCLLYTSRRFAHLFAQNSGGLLFFFQRAPVSYTHLKGENRKNTACFRRSFARWLWKKMSRDGGNAKCACADRRPTVWPGLQNACSLPHGKIVTAGCWSVSCAADSKMRKGLSNGQAFSSGNQMVKRRSLQREPASTATKIS